MSVLTNGSSVACEEPEMEVPVAALLRRLLLVTEDLRYAVREERLDEFCDTCLVINEHTVAEEACVPPVAFVLPAPEMAELAEVATRLPNGAAVSLLAQLPAPRVPAFATAWELADLLQRILDDCRGVRGIHSPAAPRSCLLVEAQALLARVARDDLTR